MSKLRVSHGDGHQEILKIFILHTITLRGFESRTLYKPLLAQLVERETVTP